MTPGERATSSTYPLPRRCQVPRLTADARFPTLPDSARGAQEAAPGAVIGSCAGERQASLEMKVMLRPGKVMTARTVVMGPSVPRPGCTRYEVRTTAMPARVGMITSAP
jgi:hypothetical protein